ncbi:erythromycin esterase family protein [Butyrivibrio sp. NC2007]|uniref:erythromycin esterase family protein n=1 Tax=Butyrivibrio sp. NC2007 TaxID=1280683 RepID=UPI0003B705E5|nr:erythromycin esterase family protein [Butyrivibrio sp. NC2007]
MEKKNRKLIRLIIVTGILLIMVTCSLVYAHLGGFSTGKSADIDEFAKYAKKITGDELPSIDVPEGTRIVALGEATHGNKEFQELKKLVFQDMVENKGIRAFVLEADTGGCEAINRYIHGGEGTLEEATETLGFQIYRTDEMADLISWMKSYNEKAKEGQDIRFYGFDMQDKEYELRYVIEALKEYGISTAGLDQLMDGVDYSDEFSREDREKILSEVRDILLENHDQAAAHYADVLIQNSKLFDEYENNPNGSFGLRDTLMAENVMWILAQEEQLGNKMIFICGHNGHMEQFGTYRGGNDKVMGNILADKVGSDAYFSIGTDFYKTTCNLPKNEKQRTTFTVYSHDPLAKAAYKSGNDICMLDFSKVPDDSSIAAQINGYTFMGSLGDQSIGGINRIVMRAIPYTYREWKNPHEAYDAMIFVSKAHPTKTRPKTGDTL